MKNYENEALKSILHDEVCKMTVASEVIYPDGKRLDVDIRYGCYCILAESLETLGNLTEPGEETQEIRKFPDDIAEEIDMKPELTVVASGNGRGKKKVSQGNSV